MVSTFTWLDYSEVERRKMLDVIDLFGEKTTRDESGIGGVKLEMQREWRVSRNDG